MAKILKNDRRPNLVNKTKYYCMPGYLDAIIILEEDDCFFQLFSDKFLHKILLDSFSSMIAGS